MICYKFSIPILILLFCVQSVSSLSNEKNETSTSLKSQAKNISETINEKMKRLKNLRKEVKELSAELRRNKFQNTESDFKQASDDLKSKNRQMRKWKKRIQKRISRLSKRLAKLERAVNAQKNVLKKPSSKPNIKHSTLSPSLTTIPPTTFTNFNKSRPGIQYSQCDEHNDCLPGHCCHKFVDDASKCIKHELNETNLCRHSCECSSHLHCFRSKNADQSHCKQAHRNDFVNGVYENGKAGIFEQ